MKPVLYLMLLCYLPGVAQSLQPQTLAVSGHTSQGNEKRLDWTAGEMAITTFDQGDQILTQGFHQPTLVVTGVVLIPELNLDVALFPNPVLTAITLRSEHWNGLSYRLFDLNGRVWLQGQPFQTQTQLNVEHLAAGSYFLEIAKDNFPIHSFTVIKK